MKTILIYPLISLFLIFDLKAQIPNNGFESWDGTDAIFGYVTTNGLTALPPNVQSVFKTTNAHSGNYACEMVATKVENKPSGYFVPDFVGSIFIGKQYFNKVTPGISFPYKPTKFEFWFKYNPKGFDTANAQIALTRWDSILTKRDTIAIGFFEYNQLDTLSFIKASVTLTYLKPETPDTAMVGISAIKITATSAGSRLIIDDLAFTGGNVGYPLFNKPIDFEVYPNPSGGIVHLKFNKNHPSISLNLYNLQGMEIWRTDIFQSSETTITTSQFETGIYLLKVRNEEGEFLKKIVVE